MTKKEIKVGDYVGFKYDIEQSGLVTKIEYRGGETWYTVKATEGGYISEGDYAMIEFTRSRIYTDED